MKRMPLISGSALAIAIAGAFGGAKIDSASAQPSASQTTDLVHCYGTNACAGQNDCKTAGNECAGKGTCKTEGFVAVPEEACEDIGGTKRDDWTGTVQTADLVHCYDVNICKGHNDCKTADNSCAGQSSCQGQGFVALPADACDLLGGEEGD